MGAPPAGNRWARRRFEKLLKHFEFAALKRIEEKIDQIRAAFARKEPLDVR